MIAKAGPGSVSPEARRQPKLKAHNSTGAMVFQAITWTSNEYKDLFDVFVALSKRMGSDGLVTQLKTVAQ